MMAPRPDTGQTVEFVEAIFTCKGDYYDPEFPKELEQLNQRLYKLLNTEKDRLIVKKVEPWNSVKVTLNIPKDAAEKLKALASHNNGSELLSMGIMSLQMEGGKILSLTLASSNQSASSVLITKGGELASSSQTALARRLSSSLPSSAASSSNTSTLNHLLNLSSSSIHKPSDSKELMNALSLSSHESSLDAKPKASDRRQRKPTTNKARNRSKKAAASTNAAAAATVVAAEVTNEPAATPSSSGGSITMNSITDLVESAFNDQLKEETDSKSTPKPNTSVSSVVDSDREMSQHSVTSVETARPTVIHPALKDSLHDKSHPTTTTVSVTGVTDKAAVNSLIASLFQHSLAADAAGKAEIRQVASDDTNSKSETDLPQTSTVTSPVDHKELKTLEEGSKTDNVLKPMSPPAEPTDSDTAYGSNTQVPDTSIPLSATSPQSHESSQLDKDEAMETTDTLPKAPVAGPIDVTANAEPSVTPPVEEPMDTSLPPENDNLPTEQPVPVELSTVGCSASKEKSPEVTEQVPSPSGEQLAETDPDQASQPPVVALGNEADESPEHFEVSGREALTDQSLEPQTSHMDVDEAKEDETTSISSTFSPQLSQDSQDSSIIHPKKEVMITEAAVRSPSSSILKSPSLTDEDTSSQSTVTADADQLSSTTTGAIFTKISSTDLTDTGEALPLIEEADDEVMTDEQRNAEGSAAAVTIVETTSLTSMEVVEKAAIAVLSSQNSASSSTGEPVVSASASTEAIAAESTETVSSPTHTHQPTLPEAQSESRELELLAPYRPDASLYNLDMVSAELPDEILEDDYLAESPVDNKPSEVVDNSTVDDIKTVATPVSVIKSPVTVQNVNVGTIVQTQETVTTMTVTETARPVATVPEPKKEAELEHNDSNGRSHQEEAVIPVEPEPATTNNPIHTVNKTTTIVHHHQHTLQHILSEHEPAENGSSTSTDSGVVPGSPKSDICATPPSVDESHLLMKTDIVSGKDYMESHEVITGDSLLTKSNGPEAKISTTLASSISASTVTTSTITTTATGSVVVSVSENRPCVSILKTVRPAHTSVISDTNQAAPRSVTTKVIQSDQKLRQHITQYSPAVSVEGKKEPRSLLVSDVNVILAAANAAQQQKSVVLQTMGSSGEVLNLVQQPVILAKTNQTGNQPTYLLHGKELLLVDQRVPLQSTDTLHTQSYLAATQGTDAGSTKPAYIIPRDRTTNHIIATSAKQQLSIKPHIVQPQARSKTPTHVIQTKEGHSFGHYIVTSSSSSSNSLNRVVARDDTSVSSRLSNMSGLPTNLPPVTIINSHLSVKNNARTLYNKPTDTQHLKPNKSDSNSSTLLIQSLSDNTVKNAEQTLDIKTAAQPAESAPGTDQPAFNPVTDAVHKVDNGVPDKLISNGELGDHAEIVGADIKTEEPEENNKLEVEIDKDSNPADNPPLISPNSQRKSGRTRKSPELEHSVVQQIPVPKARKRGARKMSEDSNQSESREDSQPPTPPTKRNNQKSLHKSSENTTPIAQSNGPSRPKRATRSSGVQDLQSLPTVYRDRGKRTKR